MRFPISMRPAWTIAMAAALSLASVPLSAQFQPPTDEELKMTVDAKAPGADAVILDREEDSDDNAETSIVHLRIKVLTEKGKELATVRVPYDHGPFTNYEVQARTIHSDGMILPLTEKPHEMTDFKSKHFQLNSLVFNLPSVEVGSLLEYWIKIRYGARIGTWELEQHQFVHREHFSFHPVDGAGVMLAARIPSGAKPAEYKKGFYTLDLTDVPPLPEEDWMPPLNTFRLQVVFYYTHYSKNTEFWKVATKSWAGVVDEFTKPTGTLKNAVVELVAPTDSEEQKARKIYDAVQKLDNTSFSRTKTQAERKKEKLKDIQKAEDVWKQRSGSNEEIALLYVAMARAAGLHVVPIQVVNRNRALWDNAIFSTEQMDDFLAILLINGKETYLDPGERMCPFGTLHWKHTLATGFRMTDRDAVLFTTPAGNFKQAEVQRTAFLDIDESGKIDGTVRVAMFGPDALYWRQLALQNDPEEVTKQFNEWIRAYIPAGVEASFDHFLGIDEYTAPLIGVVKVNGSLATMTGKRFFLPGLFFESNAAHPFVALDKRMTPIDVHYPRTDRDQVFYKIPAGYTVESLPQAADISWPGNAVLTIAPAIRQDTVEVVRTLVYNFVLLPAKDYPELHGFYQKVATADQQQLVLTRTTASKGN